MTDRAEHDDPIDPIDDRVRATFRAQLRAGEARVANGVVGPDGTTGRARAGLPVRLLVPAVLVLVAAIGIGVALAGRDDGQRLETADDGPVPTTPDRADADDADDGTAPETTDDGAGADDGDGPDDTVDLSAWAGRYEWVEFAEGAPASDQTWGHRLTLASPAGSEGAELTGRYEVDGFQTLIRTTVVARPVDDGVAIELVSATEDSFPVLAEPGDVLFTLTGEPARPVTTFVRLRSAIEAPAEATYFVRVAEPGPAGDPIPEPDPERGFTRAGGHAVVQLLDEGETIWTAVDLATGDVGPVFHRAFLEATWFSAIELAPTGDAVYLSQGFEDSWYSCESSVPDLVRLPLQPDAAPETIGRGVEPRVSPDGSRLAYLTASDCVPDPENPGDWVVTVHDTVVVRDLATGDEVRRTVPGLVEAVNGGADYRGLDLRGLAWLGDDRLGVSGGDILAAADLTPTGERLPALFGPDAFGRSLGHDPSTDSILVELATYGEDGRVSVEIVAVDIASGASSQLLAVEPGTEATSSPAGLDPTGRNLVVATDRGLLLADGTTIPLSGTVISVDW
jgi:hypothetical protein